MTDLNFFRTPKEDIMSLHLCTHDYIRHDGVCASCGMVVQTLYNTETGTIINTVAQRALADKGILPDMENVDIPDDVKAIANNIFKHLNLPTHRGKRRKLLVFFCIYNAYAELNAAKDPRSLATTVGIDPNEITKAFSLFSEVQTGYRTRSLRTNPLDLVQEYCARIRDVELNVEMVKVLTKRILDKSLKLREMYPQKVTAGVIQYYMSINGIKYNKKLFVEAMKLSEATISSMYREVSIIDNA